MYNTIFLIVAKSGAGKTTIVKELEKRYGLKSIPSYTTREPRYKNEYGHIFVSEDEFNKLKNICAYTEIQGNKYGAISEQVDNHNLYVIDEAGIDYFRKHYKGNKNIKVIYIDTSKVNRFLHMSKRGDSVEQALARINIDEESFAQASSKADIIIKNNDDIEDAITDVYEYIKKFEVVDE